MVSSNGNSTAQKFGYNGVELEESLGLDLHEMDWRGYDASLGRFMQIDPLAEAVAPINPYQFSFNNPIAFSDPSGLMPNIEDEGEGPNMGKNENNQQVIAWRPQSTGGKVSYIAEEGDTIETFMSQFGMSRAEAERVFGNAGLLGMTIIPGTSTVSGSDVSSDKDGANKQILKLDLASKQATDQRFLDQFVFAIDFSRDYGERHFSPHDFYTNALRLSYNSKARNSGKLSIDVDGVKYSVINFVSSYQFKLNSKIRTDINTFGNSWKNPRAGGRSTIGIGYNAYGASSNNIAFWLFTYTKDYEKVAKRLGMGYPSKPEPTKIKH